MWLWSEFVWTGRDLAKIRSPNHCKSPQHVYTTQPASNHCKLLAATPNHLHVLFACFPNCFEPLYMVFKHVLDNSDSCICLSICFPTVSNHFKPLQLHWWHKYLPAELCYHVPCIIRRYLYPAPLLIPLCANDIMVVYRANDPLLPLCILSCLCIMECCLALLLGVVAGWRAGYDGMTLILM